MREARRRRSRGRAGRFVSTAHSRPYVTMATASAGAGREPEPLRHHGPGPRQPRDPSPSSQHLGSVEETRTTPPNTGSHCQCRHSRVSESLARDRKAPESPKSRARSYCSAGSALLSHSGQSKALRSPPPPHLSFTKLCPPKGNSLKGEEKAIQSDKLLSNWYSVLLLRLLQQTPPPPPPQSPPTRHNRCLCCISGLPPIKPSACLARGSGRKGKGALTSDDKYEMLNHNFYTQAAV